MTPLMRKIEVACLAPNGDIQEATRLVPAIPAFDQITAAFARGTLVATGRGSTAVEDLWPGDTVRTVDNGLQTLVWRASTMIVAEARGQDRLMGRLTRIAADALGIARPMPDLVLGPWARLAHRAPAIEKLTGRDTAFVPARDFIDGDMIVELSPPSPVQVFHLAFAEQQRIVANGVEVESFHPGSPRALALTDEMAELWLSCFPHVEGLSAFGAPALPRLRRDDLDLFNVA